jgi:hypothetical protein
MKVEIDFCDDKPVFDWREYNGAPAKSWRQCEPTKPTRMECLKAAAIALFLAVLCFVGLVCAFVM